MIGTPALDVADKLNDAPPSVLSAGALNVIVCPDGVRVAVAVFVGVLVAVAVFVAVAVGVFVGTGVFVGIGVFVGDNVADGIGDLVTVGDP